MCLQKKYNQTYFKYNYIYIYMNQMLIQIKKKKVNKQSAHMLQFVKHVNIVFP